MARVWQLDKSAAPRIRADFPTPAIEPDERGRRMAAPRDGGSLSRFELRRTAFVHSPRRPAETALTAQNITQA
jgi:hypothetical protein